MFKNEMGRAGFARIQDRSGRIQLYVKKSVVGEEDFKSIWKNWTWETAVEGGLMRTRTGEATVSVTRMLHQMYEPLPDKWKGVADPEFKNRQRCVDLFMDAESRETFRRRSLIVHAIRDFFEARDYLEVETPMMQIIPGGAPNHL